MTHDPRDALEPCPFCGGNNVILSHKWDYGFIRRYPYCNGCGARGPSFNGEEEARAWWNTRALTASPGEQKPFGWVGSDGKFLLPSGATREQFLSNFEDVGIGTPLVRVYLSPPPAAGIIEREIAAQSILARVRRVRDGYANQAKFADVDQASYFREFVRRLDDAVNPKPSTSPWNGKALRREAPASAGVALADWSDLPKDIYVTSAKRVNAVGYDVQCCSVPMVTSPEVRYVRADMITAPPSRPDAGGGVREADRLAKLFRDERLDFPILDENDDEIARLPDSEREFIAAALSTPSATAESNYYAIQAALSPHIASSTELMAAMSSIWPLIDSPAAAESNASVDARLREALLEIANRAANMGDPDATDWLPSIYLIACESAGEDPWPLLRRMGYSQDGLTITLSTAVGDEEVSNVMRSALKAKATVSSWSASKQEYANRAISGDEAKKSEGGPLNWQLSDDAKARLAEIDANLRNAAINASNIVAGNPSSPTAERREIVARVLDRWKRSKNLHESLAAQSIEKELLAALDGGAGA